MTIKANESDSRISRYLTDMMRDEVVRQLEATIRAKVEPEVDRMIKDAALAAASGMTVKLEAMKVDYGSHMEVRVWIGGREFNLDGTDAKTGAPA